MIFELNRILIATLIIIVLIVGFAYAFIVINRDEQVQENWPVVDYDPRYKGIALEALEKYKYQGRDYNPYLQNYDPFGNYLNINELKKHTYVESEQITLDNDGLPKVKYGEDFYYSTVTVSQYALTHYGLYLSGEEESLNKFITAADKILELQDESGAFPNNFKYRFYLSDEIYDSGWFSAMDTGQALSVFARAYHSTGDEKYLKAGNKALEFLITPIEDGGVMTTLEDLDPSLKDYIFFEEYVTQPNNYTLNGYMFTLLGLYDWNIVTEEYLESKNNIAKKYFNLGMETLVNILPYYDIGGFTSYDLGHMTFEKDPHPGIGYHMVHIYLLHALYSVTEEVQLKHFENIWRYYVE